VLARDIVDLLRFGACQDLIHRVELSRLGVVRQIAGVNNEVRLILECIDLVDGRLKRSCDILIGRLIEADVAVADLNEMEFVHGSFSVLTECLLEPRSHHYGPNYAGTGPRHALQKVSTVDAIVVVIVNDSFRQMPLARSELNCFHTP
jgi:hypothetical protein